MSFIMLNPGDLVCDALTVPPASKVKAAGYKGFAGYLKNFSVAQVADYANHGLVLWLISEFQAGRPLQGARQGAIDGAYERRKADALGYKGPIIIAIDYNVGPANVVVTLEYARAFRQAAGVPCGIYGDWDVAAAEVPGEFSPVWKPAAEAWSWQWVVNKFVRRTHPLTDIHQKVSGALIPGVDHGVVLRPIQGWVPAATDPVVPTPVLSYTAASVRTVNPQVRLWQQACNFWGWRPAGVIKITEDGKFGPQTRDATVVAQKALKLPASGIYEAGTASAFKGLLTYFASLRK